MNLFALNFTSQDGRCVVSFGGCLREITPPWKVLTDDRIKYLRQWCNNVQSLIFTIMSVFLFLTCPASECLSKPLHQETDASVPTLPASRRRNRDPEESNTVYLRSFTRSRSSQIPVLHNLHLCILIQSDLLKIFLKF